MYRHLALITIEATTPLYLSAGDEHLVFDNQVIRDHHGLPVIYASQITGALSELYQRSFDKLSWQRLFGQSDEDKKEASLLVPSDTVLRDSNHQLVQLYCPKANIQTDPLLNNLLADAPIIIDRVKLNDYGVVDNKFDYTVLPTGCRFSFTLELEDTTHELAQAWQNVLSLFNHPLFKLGSATHNGFGALKVIVEHSYQFSFNLTNEYHVETLLQWDQHPSNFPTDFIKEQQDNTWPEAKEFKKDIISVNHNIVAKHGLHFGATEQDLSNWVFGSEVLFGDNKDTTAQVKKIERLPFIKWGNDASKPQFSCWILPVIPSTAIKGAILQQAKYLASRGYEQYLPALTLLTGMVNEEKNVSQASILDWQVNRNDQLPTTFFEKHQRQHNFINRLTSGVMNGGLFSEEYTWQDNFDVKITLDKYRLDLLLEHPEVKKSSDITKESIAVALVFIDRAIADLNDNLLKLGGLNNMGYGTVAITESSGQLSTLLTECLAKEEI